MKSNLTKVEALLAETLRKIFIERLSELAAIAHLIQNSSNSLTPALTEKITAGFQNELKELKKKDSKLYSKLALSPEDEERFNLPPTQYLQDDWIRLKNLKERIDDLKRELQGEELLNQEDEERIKQERLRHIYKRFNVREGWLPLD